MSIDAMLNADGHQVKCPDCGSPPGTRCWGNGPFVHREAHASRRKADAKQRIAKWIGAHREAVYNACIEICIAAQEPWEGDDTITGGGAEAARIEGRIRALLDGDEYIRPVATRVETTEREAAKGLPPDEVVVNRGGKS